MLFSSKVSAIDVFLDALYWRATETIDWALTNDVSTPHQNIAYKTISFNYDPGFRIGLDYKGNWDAKIYYTKFYTKASQSASGNLVSTFLGGKLLQGNNFFQTGQVNFTIDLSLCDVDFSKCCYLTDNLMLRPVIGLKAGRINQHIVTSFQGPISVFEMVKNNFRGIGPKAGIESNWIFCRNNGYQFSLFSDFTTSYLWGRWNIRDVANDNTLATVLTKVGRRNLGAFTLQGILGIKLDYQCLSMKLGYEIADWFNQYQVLDDGTGAHNNNLVLQGLTLRLSYDF